MILLIDNYDSFTFNLYQLIAQYGLSVKVLRNDKVNVELIKTLPIDGIVISPGPGRPENAGNCISIIKQFAPKLPILGICLGHQAIAKAFGGNIIQCNKIVHGKSNYVFHRRSELFRQMPLPFKAGRYHSLQVNKKTLPSDLQIEAENEDGIIMALKHRQYPCYGLQFHPESILTPSGNILIENFIKRCDPKQHLEIAC